MPNNYTLADLAKPDDFFKEVDHILAEKSYKWLLINSKHNGLQEAGAVIISNHKRLIVKPLFTTWLLNH